jgi:hypothetical protein
VPEPEIEKFPGKVCVGIVMVLSLQLRMAATCTPLRLLNVILMESRAIIVVGYVAGPVEAQ